MVYRVGAERWREIIRTADPVLSVAVVYGNAMRDSAENATQGSGEPLAYSLADAARLLSVGKRKVEYMIQSGELGSIKIGRARRIPRSELLAYLKQQSAA